MPDSITASEAFNQAMQHAIDQSAGLVAERRLLRQKLSGIRVDVKTIEERIDQLTAQINKHTLEDVVDLPTMRVLLTESPLEGAETRHCTVCGRQLYMTESWLQFVCDRSDFDHERARLTVALTRPLE